MITVPAGITTLEQRGLYTLINRVLDAEDPPVRRVLLFGSKARGDFDDDSDIDLLLICDLPPEDRYLAGRILARDARIVSAESGLRIETWTITTADLRVGARTPMLIDAVEDGYTLWPTAAPPLRLRFTPPDARFCARRLLEWVDDGEAVIREALARSDYEGAAQRSRDDITRLVTAALLLEGETRHRRISSIEGFIRYFIETGYYPTTMMPALEWAIYAFPPDGGRGSGRPPPTKVATRTAHLGSQYSRFMAEALAPELRERAEEPAENLH